MSEITVIVHTHNSARTLNRLLDSVTWAQEVIAIDMSSTDGTRELLSQRHVTVHELEEQPWNDSLRNSYLSLPTRPWTLVLDSDEYVSDDCEELVARLTSSASSNIAAFSLPRYNWCFGRVLQDPRWYPDRQVRLFRTNSVTYSSQHHRSPSPIEPGARVVEADISSAPHIHHDHYASIQEFASRQVRYAVTDSYDEPLDWSAYSRVAIEGVLRARQASSPEERAMELILGWDSILRALVHWEHRGRVDDIPADFGWAFGVQSVSVNPSWEGDHEVVRLLEELAEAQEQISHFHNTSSWRVTAPLRILKRWGQWALRSFTKDRAGTTSNRDESA